MTSHRGVALTRREVDNKSGDLFVPVPARRNVKPQAEIIPPIEHHGYDEFGHYLRITGTETLVPVTVKTTAYATPTSGGDVLMVISAGPQDLVSTRAQVLAKLYEKYKLQKFQLRYVPQVGTSQNGTLIIAPFEDAADTWIKTSERDMIIKATGYENNIMFQVSQPATCPAPVDGRMADPEYTQVGAEARFEVPVLFAVLAGSTFTDAYAAQEITLGWLKVDYDIRFYDPVHTQVTGAYAQGDGTFVLTIASYFDPLYLIENAPLYGNESQWTLPNTNGGYYTLRCNSTATAGGTAIVLRSDNLADFTWSQGTFLYFRRSNADAAWVHFYASLEDCIGNVNPLRWANPVLSTDAFNLRYDISFVSLDDSF